MNGVRIIILIFIIFVLLIHVLIYKRRNNILIENKKRYKKEVLRLQILTNVLTRKFISKQEQLDYLLHQALKLTQSQYGYIYLYDEERREFCLNSWTSSIIKDCILMEESMKYELDKTGVCEEVVRQKKPIVINDVHKECVQKKGCSGCPKGYGSLNKLMTIPVIIDDEIVAIVGVGNKSRDYNDEDIYHLTALMSGVWHAVERRKTLENIEYLSFHDSLTDLYNRRFFDEEVKRLDRERNLPISIIMGDVNGLKFTNDIFGHSYGDLLLKKIAEVLKEVCRADDIIARIGGDEFMILLPRTNYCEAKKIISRIKNELPMKKVRFIKCDMSLGAYTKVDKNQSFKEVIDKAEEKMYFEKSIRKKEVQEQLVSFIINELHKISETEYNHYLRVSQLCKKLGRVLFLPEDEIQNLKTAGYIHDIGKVALDQKYFDKEYKLCYQEIKEMKKHPLLGYRILNLVHANNKLAEAVLHHHELWDGSGYPQGLKGEEIPLYSRIISLAECYDRYTNENDENNPIEKKEVLSHIKEFAGQKYDPKLAELFIKIIE